MELHEGKMSIKELSEWFGLKPETLSKSSQKAKDKKFKILEAYADYHFEGKKLIIDKVKYSTYSKAFEIIEEEMPKRWGVIMDDSRKVNETLKKERIDTCARVGGDIWYNIPEVKAQISLTTSKRYTNTIKVQKYGHNYLNDYGTCGRSEYVWMNEKGTAPLGEWETSKIKECSEKAYGDKSLLIASIDDDFRHGYISKEERDKAVGSIETNDNYDYFVELVIQELGFYPEKRTRLIDERNW